VTLSGHPAMVAVAKLIEVVQSATSSEASTSEGCAYGACQKRKAEPPTSLMMYSSTVPEVGSTSRPMAGE